MNMPKATREQVVAAAEKQWKASKRKGPMPTHYLFAVRGYWPVSMGPTNKNDTNVWDDVWILVTPNKFVAIAANVDPTRHGWNSGAGKPMAVLDPGFWPFRRGAHKGKTPALRQITPEEAANIPGVPNKGYFSVTRTYATGDARNWKDVGYFAINMHRGGENSTSSEGCLTSPQALFDDFMNLVWQVMAEANMKFIWVGLIDGPIN